MQDVCRELELIHVVDLFRTEPLGSGPDRYTRLHGRNADPYDDDDSREARQQLAAMLADRPDAAERAYPLLNSYEM